MNPPSLHIPQKYLEWIDIAKGIAILEIICFHFFQNYPQRLPLISLLDKVGAKLALVFVDVFFVIAGFNISYSLAISLTKKSQSLSQYDWWDWLKKRLIRLYPAYWLAIILSLAIYYFFFKIKINSLEDFIYIVLGLPNYDRFKSINPGFWFFSVIVQAYLFIPLVIKLFQGNFIRIFLFGSVFGILTKFLSSLFFKIGAIDLHRFFLQNNFIGSYSLALTIGLYWGFVYFKFGKFRKQDWNLSWLLLFLGIGLQLITIYQKQDIPYMLGFDLVFTPIAFLLMYLLTTNPIFKIKRINKVFTTLGKYSYQIYLVHQPVFMVVLPWLIGKMKPEFSTETFLISLVFILFFLFFYIKIFLKLETFFKNIKSDLG
jgi:peptidoglycan/LPS O-acetylase OafA/YrhL